MRVLISIINGLCASIFVFAFTENVFFSLVGGVLAFLIVRRYTKPQQLEGAQQQETEAAEANVPPPERVDAPAAKKKSGIEISLFGKKEKQELEKLKSLMTPEMQDHLTLQKAIEDARKTLEETNLQIAASEKQIDEKQAALANLCDKIVETDEAVMLQSFGLYTPRYPFMNSDEYKARLLELREEQKNLIKQKMAVSGLSSWTVNGSASKGKKMVLDMQKLLLRAFNSECDDIIAHVRFSNLEASEKRITASKDAISKLGSMMGVEIRPSYYKLKIEELYLAFEYQKKKQEEKEEQKEARARMREEAKLAREIEEARKKLEKEQQHYQNALAKIRRQLAAAGDGSYPEIEEKKQQIENQLAKIDREFRDVDYREANQRAGYVYVISNIGAFGEDVYKIGMTRRLDPMDRVDELGDASVPFNFDVHAMIFSDDAPKLEAALHNAFADRKLNFVNQRREFFRVSLAEIKQVVKSNFDKSVEFIEVAPAEQYRESLLLREQLKSQEAQ